MSHFKYKIIIYIYKVHKLYYIYLLLIVNINKEYFQVQVNQVIMTVDKNKKIIINCLKISPEMWAYYCFES